MAKFLGNLLKDSTLSLFNIASTIFPLGSLFDSKMPLVNFFWTPVMINESIDQSSDQSTNANDSMSLIKKKSKILNKNALSRKELGVR